jgi:hypothetical protein
MIEDELMNLLIAVSALICLALGMCLWLLLRSVRSAAGTLPVTTDWLDDLSTERYRPMLRLIDEEDLRFLRKQPGFTPQMFAKFRAQRCRIFRGYLRAMQVDFGRICTALKIVLAQSQQDRPDLASALLQSQITFACGMVAVQFRLLLYRWGCGKVEVTGLVKVFDGMRLELRTFVPAEVTLTA